MPFNIMDMLGMKEETEEGYQDIIMDIDDIVVTQHNKYTLSEIDDLAAGIEMTGGVQQPLLLALVDGEYLLTSGGRRREALMKLVQEGKEEYRKVPCRYKEMTELQFRMELLIGNTFNRKLSDHDLMMQAAEWKDILKQAKEEGMLELEKGERVRDYVAKILGESTGKIGQLEAINNNATESIKEQMAAGNIGVTTAHEASKLPEDTQEEIAERVAAGEDVKSTEIQKIIEEQEDKKEKRNIEEQKRDNVSDTDTKEDDDRNSKRLHLLKMLEKYYIYLSDDEERILRDILEDCKRRKREYTFEDCGETV